MDIAGVKITLEQVQLIVGAAVTVAVGIVIALTMRILLRRSIRKKLPPHVYLPFERLVVYGIIILTLIAVVKPLGLDLSSLLVAGGILGIVIGFASQTVVSNLLSGFFLYIDKPLKLGDTVSVDGVEGVVLDISIFSTKILSWDGCVVRVPNEKLFNSVITNFVASPVRRISFKIRISYNSDIEKAKRAIMKVIEEHPFTLINPPPIIFVDEYGDSAIMLNVICWAPSSVWFNVKAEIQSRIKAALDEAGVEIALPQRVVWLKKAE